MTKYIYTIIIYLIFHQLNFAQNLKKINESNIIFIFFDESYQEQKKITKATYEKNDDKKPYLYEFYFYNKNKSLGRLPIVLNYVNWVNSEKNPQRFRIHKSFLKKNKEIILTQEFIHRIGRLNTVKLLNKAKTIFLIDKSEIKNRGILIKQVFFNDYLIM